MPWAASVQTAWRERCGSVAHARKMATTRVGSKWTGDNLDLVALVWIAETLLPIAKWVASLATCPLWQVFMANTDVGVYGWCAVCGS